MLRSYVCKRVKKWDNNALEKAKNAIRGGASIADAAKRFKIPYETLRGKVSRLHPNPNVRPTTLSKQEEEDIAHAFVYLSEAGAPVGRRQLCQTVKSFLDNVGRETRFENNLPGKDWILAFEHRNSHILTRRKPEILTSSRARALNKDVLKAFFDMWEQILEKNCLRDQPHRIFNCDETGLNTDPTYEKIYTRKGASDAYLQTATCGKDITNARPNEEMQEMVTYVIVNYEGAHFLVLSQISRKSQLLFPAW